MMDTGNSIPQESLALLFPSSAENGNSMCFNKKISKHHSPHCNSYLKNKCNTKQRRHRMDTCLAINYYYELQRESSSKGGCLELLKLFSTSADTRFNTTTKKKKKVATTATITVNNSRRSLPTAVRLSQMCCSTPTAALSLHGSIKAWFSPQQSNLGSKHNNTEADPC